jgi:hypothetical protein
MIKHNFTIKLIAQVLNCFNILNLINSQFTYVYCSIILANHDLFRLNKFILQKKSKGHGLHLILVISTKYPMGETYKKLE